MLIVALVAFVSIPILGSQFYFRHDDAAILLWAKEYTQPLHHIFSTNPELNRVDYYPGPAGTWRPFSWFYIKILWNLFGASPAPYFIIAGLAFMLAALFLFKMVKEMAGIPAATLSCLALFAAFNGTMYNLFHIGVPVSYLFQLAMICCFWFFLERRKIIYLLGIILLLGPATVRQTTPIILTAILIVYLFNHRKEKKILSAANFAAAVVLAIGYYLIALTPNVSDASVLSVFPDVAKIISFMSVRFMYYGALLTNGMAGLIMILVIGGGSLFRVEKWLRAKLHYSRTCWLWLPADLLVTFIFLKAGASAVYWLVICFIFLFIVDRELRVPIAWAGASLFSYFSVQYYHNGYLLEAGFPLAVTLGVLTSRFMISLYSSMKVAAERLSGRAVTFLCAALAFFLCVSGVLTAKKGLQTERADVIRISIDSNRNFKQLIHYLRDELPEGATVYEISEKEMETTSRQRRYQSLKQRAASTKIMNIRDTKSMLKVLDREDINIFPASELSGKATELESYFIALNNVEREEAESRFILKPIREFNGSLDSAAIYQCMGAR